MSQTKKPSGLFFTTVFNDNININKNDFLAFSDHIQGTQYFILVVIIILIIILFSFADSKLPRLRVCCWFVNMNCYFYANSEAVPNLQTSLIAPELFTALLSYKVWVSFSCWGFCAISDGLLPWPLLTTLAHLSISDFIPPGLDFLLLLTPAPT